VGRQARTAAEVGEFRERVCRAAAHLFAERGFAGVTLRAVADEVGTSAMTPYRYFRDKADIFAAVRTAAYERFADAQEQAAATPGAPAERLAALGRAYARFALEDSDGYRLMFELAQPDPDGYPALRDAEMRAWSPLRKATAAAIEAGVLAGDPDTVANVLWAGLHGLVSLSLARKLVHGKDVEALLAPMLGTLFRGNLPPGESPT
jgi:AcrR family transcriptional regulator